jgi:hypothetical protein
MSVTSLNPSTLDAVADQCVELADYIEEWGKETPWMKNAPLGTRLFEVRQAAAVFARALRDLADEVERGTDPARVRPRRR